MAVKASSNITLYHVIDIDNVTIYYLLQSSTANPPAKPTTDNPGGSWTTTEPTYTEGSTNTLYTVTKTKFSDGNFEYTPVSKSSSYEAAKNAYNKALNADTNANTALNTINNLEIGGKNILRKTKTFSNEGVLNTATGYLRNKGTITTAQSINDFTVITCTPSSAVALGEWLINGCKNGETYTLSFWVKGAGAPRCYFYGPSGYIGCEKVITQNGIGNSSDGNSDSRAGGVPVSNSEWQRVWVTWKLKDTGGTTDQKYVLIRNDNKVEVYIAGVKFERGDKATDWTPAPEDIDEAIINLDSKTDVINNQMKNTVTTGQLQSLEGRLINTMISNFGINHIRDSMGVFNDGSWKDVNGNDADVESVEFSKAVGLNGIKINNTLITQSIKIPNGIYTLSLKYEKNNNIEGSLVINYEGDIQTLTNSNIYVLTKEFNSPDGINNINITLSGDADNLGIVFDLMLNSGSEAKEWQQNQNETVTDTVTIGRGIKCESTVQETTSYMNAAGFNVKNNISKKDVMKATSTGGWFNTLTSVSDSQINFLMFSYIDDEVWLNSIVNETSGGD